jgi:hypothetical protein
VRTSFNISVDARGEGMKNTDQTAPVDILQPPLTRVVGRKKDLAALEFLGEE